jgi:hypothetical protein
MKIPLEKIKREGEMIPRLYGVAYRNPIGDYTVCYPVPLNWLVRYGRILWWKLAIPKDLDSLERRYLAMRRAWYEAGYKDGCADSKDSLTVEHWSLRIDYRPALDTFRFSFPFSEITLTTDTIAHLAAGRAKVQPVENDNA